MNTIRTHSIYSPVQYPQYPMRSQPRQSPPQRWRISPWFVISVLLIGFIVIRQLELTKEDSNISEPISQPVRAQEEIRNPLQDQTQNQALSQAQNQARSISSNISRAFLDRTGGGDTWRTPEGLTILNRPGEGLRVLSMDPKTENILWFAWDRDVDGRVDAAADLSGCYPAEHVPCESRGFRGPENPGSEHFKFWQERFEKTIESVK
jgi:hypothetical protein